MQRWVIPSLHYGLRKEGYLLLGRSETIGGFTELFETVDRKHKVFRKLSPAFAAGLFRFPVMGGTPGREAEHASPGARDPALESRLTRDKADEAVLAVFAPPGVTVDFQLAIVEFRGDTGPYLVNRPGRPSLNLLDMVSDDLAGKVRSALAEVQSTGVRAVIRGVGIGEGKRLRAIDLHVIPFTSRVGEPHYLVLFEQGDPGSVGAERGAKALQDAAGMREADVLRDELSATRERLEAVIQAKEAVNEELRAANEEMLSSGEEMQSINEELETTQEELQSTNQELRVRNLELGQVTDDLGDLLTSVHFPIIMVGRDLRIRRFTPSAARLLHVIASDIGRRITDLRLRIGVPDLAVLLTEVIDTGTLRERDVQDDDGRWYTMQVRPYKTSDDRVEGAAVTLFDIDEMTRLFAAQKSIATTLQRQYIHALPEVEGLELAAVAETAHHLDLIGGDFHDVFPLPGGEVLIVIGDVAGKGVKAAGLAETVRIAARATALMAPLPEAILSNVHRLVGAVSDEFVTALVAVFDPATGDVVFASAGHPAPIHLSGSGCSSPEPRYGPPLGAFEPNYLTRRLTLARGDTLVLYTDGVTEARHDGVQFEVGRVVEILCEGRDSRPQALVERLRDAVLAFADELRDDLQIVAVRRT
jgi:serine phosphatase RsbU (regulator of sigma subunit)